MPIFEKEGIRLYYNVKGEGVPIVFIHPPLLTSANFKYQMDDLSKHYKVICFDIRGHGQSSYSEQPLTYRLIADDIRNLLDHLRISKAYLCGYSTGGSIVLEFLLTTPDRALCGIIVSGMSEVFDWYNEKRIVMARMLAKTGAKRLLALGISWGNSDSKETFKTMYHESLFGDTRNIAQYYNYSLEYNCTNQLHTIHHPILLIYGEKDKAFHKYAKILNEKLPHNELKFIKEKHQIPTKSASEFNQLIRGFIQLHK
ncbi:MULTISPECIES: alpha/beta fold hydrolase [Neobacillus]|uniref:Alpha/beta hydrolase n=1 Tax=Neobacillus rhizophilus TaxID=2833579 RepID=A0A942U2H6_9BACI|nr:MULTISPECIES: alpha/beta hydrolase [Neobacillus]MBS4211308.1 alpha/beta hydrolase [Neobacillus rhizophilus]MBU8918830.1 alpha/beta hydrolase [Bacillus sp. FJAT-29953]